MTDVLSPQDRSRDYEADRVKRRKAAPVGYRSASDVRHELLRALKPGDGPMYDPEALALVEEFEAALRDAWEREERRQVEQRAREAVRDALAAISDGRLL